MGEPEQLKYHAARYIWRKRKAITPSGGMTWGEWFEDRYSETLQDYAKRMARDGQS